MDVRSPVAPADPRAHLGPKLRTYAAIHDADGAGRRPLRRRGHGFTPRAGGAAGLDHFEREIEHHHEREDELVFPWWPSGTPTSPPTS